MKGFNVVIYAVGALLGLASGASFSKAMYHKGKVDAYKDCEEKLSVVIKETEEMIKAKEAEKESE